MAKRYGWERTRAALKAVMAETPLEYLNVPKVLAVWVENGGRPPDGRARAPTGVGDRAMAAARSVIERHRRQE